MDNEWYDNVGPYTANETPDTERDRSRSDEREETVRV